VGGLTMNDFVLAAKIDRLVARRGGRKTRRRA
jgi:pterin-4a-carbinolamine dehydratase